MDQKTVLIIGSGGREHALAWKLSKSQKVRKIYCAPGNAGIGTIATLVPIEANEIEKLADFAEKTKIDLTIVGPEGPLADGIVDLFTSKGLKIFGPDKKAARLEESKVFAKELMEKHNIPNALFAIFDSTDEIRKNMNLHGFEEHYFPMVIKIDGLAAGKGVQVCKNRQEAEDFLSVIDSGKFGKAASRIIMENCLFGEEASCIYITDKNGSVLPMATAQDHKAVFDKDEGPNTGGMGAYSPAPIVSIEVEEKIAERIINPLIEALRAESMLSAGVIYVGLMIDEKGDPYVLEFNARFGDPEIQPILMRLETDLMEIIESAMDWKLDQQKIKWNPLPAVCVVMASKGYPDKYAKGFPIAITYGTENINTTIFHAGTAFDNSGELVTAGGRVLDVTALGVDTLNAKNNAYRAVKRIRCPNLFYRTDIADKAIDPSLL